MRRAFYKQHCQCVKAWNAWLTPAQPSRVVNASCERVMDPAVTYRRPDKLAFLLAFGEQAQTISISPKNFNGAGPRRPMEDKQVTGEGIIIQHMLYLVLPVRRRIYAYRVTPATSQTRVPDGVVIISLPVSSRDQYCEQLWRWDFPASCYCDGIPPCRNRHRLLV